MAGGGVAASDARAELVAFAEKLSIPVATALNAKAMFPAEHPLAVGTPGSYSRACANQVLYEADLVFFIGSHSGGQVTHGYRVPPQGTPIIQLDINPEEIGRNYPIETGMQGDARSSLRRMIEMAEAGSQAGKTATPATSEGSTSYSGCGSSGKSTMPEFKRDQGSGRDSSLPGCARTRGRDRRRRESEGSRRRPGAGGAGPSDRPAPR